MVPCPEGISLQIASPTEKSGYAAPNCQKFLHLTEHAHLVQPRDDAGPTGLGLGYHNCCNHLRHFLNMSRKTCTAPARRDREPHRGTNLPICRPAERGGPARSTI